MPHACPRLHHPHQYLAKSTNREASVSCHFLPPNLDLSCYNPTTVSPYENWLKLGVRLVSLLYACFPPSLSKGLVLEVWLVSFRYVRLPPPVRERLRLDVGLVSLSKHSCSQN